MEYTKNYHLPQWVESDRILMEDFNKMCADIEAGLDTVKDGAAEGLTALENSLNADIVGINQEMSALAADLGNAGNNCRFTVGSYTGANKYGSSNPNSLTFSFVPYLVLVYDSTDGGDELHMIRSSAKGAGYANGNMIVSWSGKKVTWYSANSAARQYNAENVYRYIAFGVDE